MRLLLLPLFFCILLTHSVAAQPDRHAMIEQLEQRFGSAGAMQTASSAGLPGRCLLPYHQMYDEVGDELTPATQARLKELLTAPADDPDIQEKEYLSESGKFRILYTTEGPDSIPAVYEMDPDSEVPDYVINTAQYADSTYRYQVETLGFVDPTVHQGQECGNREGEWQDSVITIRYRDFKDDNGDFNIYGAFYKKRPFEFIVHSNYDGAPKNDYKDINDNRLGALMVTIAHEFKHVSQYATNCMRGDAGAGAWVEMDATMMENIVHPDVNDYYNYIVGATSVFNKPDYSVPAYNDNTNAWYNQVTWSLFFAENYGMAFWVDVWDRIHANHDLPFLDAMRFVLDERYGDTFESALIRNHLWHLASGDRSLGDYGFQEKERYPNAYAREIYNELADRPGELLEIPLRAAQYSEFKSGGNSESGEIALSFFSDSLNTGVGLLAEMNSGEVQEFVIPSLRGNPQNWEFPLNWEDVQWLGIVRVNSDQQIPLRNELYAGAGAGVEQLVYGDVSGSGLPGDADALSMLRQRLYPENLSGFDRYIHDVSGNGRISPYDAARVYHRMADPNDPERAFPVDENSDGKGPEWSRFMKIESSDGPFFPAAVKNPPVDDQDTITAILHMMSDRYIPEDEMDLVLNVPGAADSTWFSLYLEIAIDYPQDDEYYIDDEWVELELEEILANNGNPDFEGWIHNTSAQNGMKVDTLKLAYASQNSFGTTENSDELLTLRLIPKNSGQLHFKLVALELDEYSYHVDHPLMKDIIRVEEPVDVQPAGERPVVFSLEQNYPNPFNPVTTISFGLPETAPVRLQVFDITGRLITTLVDETIDHGFHSVRFDARSHREISSGVYLYRLDVAGQTSVRKMTVIK